MVVPFTASFYFGYDFFQFRRASRWGFLEYPIILKLSDVMEFDFDDFNATRFLFST